MERDSASQQRDELKADCRALADENHRLKADKDKDEAELRQNLALAESQVQMCREQLHKAHEELAEAKRAIEVGEAKLAAERQAWERSAANMAAELAASRERLHQLDSEVCFFLMLRLQNPTRFSVVCSPVTKGQCC